MTKRLFVLLGLMICAGVAAAEPLVEGSVEAGKKKSAACAACHGPQGNMQSAQFPKLAGQGSPYLYEQLKLFKSGERESAVMAGQVAGLSKQDMRDLAAYFAAQQTRPGVADPSIAPAGAAIYHGGKPEEQIPACAGCHGPSGLGNAAALFPRLSGQNPEYVVTQLKAYRSGERAGYAKAAIMNGVAEELTDADIRALASYVAGLVPARGNVRNDKGALMQQVSGPDNAGDQAKDQAKGQAKDQAKDQAAGSETDGGGKTPAGDKAGDGSQSASGEAAAAAAPDQQSDQTKAQSQTQ